MWIFHFPRLFKVMLVHTSKETNGIPAPTISLFPYSKNNSLFRSMSTEQLEAMCLGDHSCDEYLTKSTYNQSDVLIDIFLGFTRKLSILGEKEIVTENMTRPSFGRYYVFRPSFTIGTNYRSDQIYLALSRDLNYVLHIYDPHFYFGLFNPSVPMIKEIIRPDDTAGKYYNLVLTEVRERMSHLPKRYNYTNLQKRWRS